MSKRRVLALVPEGSIPPQNLEGLSDKEIAVFKMEYDVVAALEALGHSVRCLDVRHDLSPIREAVQEWKPHVVFNMLEEFHGFVAFDQNVVSYLELLRTPYTGCNPRGLVLARDKALTKKILAYHRIPCPRFAVFPEDRVVRAPKRLRYPAIVKSLVEESSTAISQASIVHDEDQLVKRVQFVHEQVGDAIAEEYIEGRELYLGILGNHRLQTFPLWELVLDALPEGAPRIATERVKHDLGYQEKHKITTRQATGLADGLEERVARVGKKIYRLLGLSGYARLDIRLREDGTPYVIEANPNPDLASDEDFASAAEAGGLTYERLIQRILNLGLRAHKRWHH